MFNINHWEQPDWSIVDIYWNIITTDERIKIIETVENLPVSFHKDNISNTVSNNVITIIQRETGSWKTTQVPKILEKHWNIITTQPRVISAISLSDRVSREIMADSWDITYSVWMKVWYRTGQQVSSKYTSPISFHTDWLEFMRQWISWVYPDILILDEIHWFSIPTEMIASNIRKFLSQTKWKVKLVLMSATLDPVILQDYFSCVSKDIPLIKIPWRTHNVEKYFNPGENHIKTVSWLYKKWKNVLLFVEWKKEIKVAIDMLKKELGDKATILPLHSELPIKDQIKVLKKEDDKPVIVVSTNIAEESITIDYIDAVVDVWREKTIFVNHYWVDELRTIDISKANSMQRAWRSWRTHEWVYIRTNSTPFDELDDYAISPIEREMLDRYILISLVDWVNIQKDFEDLFIHIPQKELVDLSYARLKFLWAINNSWEITRTWIDLLKFPVSVYNSMILLESIQKWCSEDIIPMVAILEKKWFVSKTWNWKEIKVSGKREWDLFGYVDLFNLVTSTKLSNWKLELLRQLWVDADEISIFKELDWKKMLFEVVLSLEEIWIKTKKVFEIYNTIKNIKDRFEKLWNTLEKSKNIIDVKSSLIAGSLHNIFRYNEATWKFRSYNDDIDLEFKAWDTSLVELVDNWIYIWSPFIIWWTSTKWDFRLLTNLVRVEEWIVKEYYEKFIDEDIWEIFWHSNPNHKFAKITEDELQDFSIDDVKFNIPDELITIKDKTKIKSYLAKNWLPYFLVKHNIAIVKFISSKWLNSSIFAELLKKITIFEEHRINPENLNKTIHSFGNDTEILDQFLDSDDKTIRLFLTWKIIKVQDLVPELDKKVVSKSDRSEIMDGAENSISETKELIEYKKMYFKVLASIKKTDLLEEKAKLTKEFLTKFFKNIETRDDYSDVLFNYIQLLNKNWNRTEILNYLQELRQLNRKKTIIEKIIKSNVEIEKFINLILWKEINGDLDISKYIKDDKSIKKFKSAILLSSSQDIRQKLRWDRILKWFANELKTIIYRNNLSIWELTKDTTLNSFPLIKELYNSIEKFLENIFENNEFFELMIKPKIIDQIVLKILSSYLDGNKSPDQIFINFLIDKDLSRAKIGTELFKCFKELESISYDLENYENDILDWVRKTSDTEYVKYMIENLSNIKEKKSNIIHEIKMILDKEKTS